MKITISALFVYLKLRLKNYFSYQVTKNKETNPLRFKLTLDYKLKKKNP